MQMAVTFGGKRNPFPVIKEKSSNGLEKILALRE
jgi:hypothetical protein